MHRIQKSPGKFSILHWSIGLVSQCIGTNYQYVQYKYATWWCLNQKWCSVKPDPKRFLFRVSITKVKSQYIALYFLQSLLYSKKIMYNQVEVHFRSKSPNLCNTMLLRRQEKSERNQISTWILWLNLVFRNTSFLLEFKNVHNPEIPILLNHRFMQTAKRIYTFTPIHWQSKNIEFMYIAEKQCSWGFIPGPTVCATPIS